MTNAKCVFKAIANLVLLSWITTASAHTNHKIHTASLEKPASSAREQGIKNIQNEYSSWVKPIFQKSCFDCHSSSTHYPWYHRLPLVKQIIDSDIAESKKHLDFTYDFPFAGHGSPEEDLDAIGKAIQEGTMPPFRYRILHPGNSVTVQEKAAVQTWIHTSLKILRETPEAKSK